jgi:RNA polymerase sigma factor (sigma-70 family)
MSAAARRAVASPVSEPADVSIGTLFDEHASMVLAICRYQTRDPHSAEDAAQETFLSAHRSLLGGTRPRDPAAWLATIARNECRRTWRTVHTSELDDHACGTALDPADIVVDRAELSEVARAIAELPDRQREALVLREFCGLSYEQVAAAMSLSGAAIDSLLSRARRRVSEQFGDLPRAARGVILVPPSFREALSRFIPELDQAGAAAGVASGAGGFATLASLGSAPLAAKVAATGAAAVALALPLQPKLHGSDGTRAGERPAAAARVTKPAGAEFVRSQPPAPATASTHRSRHGPDRKSESGSSGPGSSSSESNGSSGSGTSGSGPGPSVSGSTSGGSGSGSSGSSSDSSGSSGSGSGSSGSGPASSPSEPSRSGSGSSGSGSSSSGSGSTSSGSGSSGSGSSGFDSGSGSVSGSSGSGSSGSSGSSDSSDSSSDSTSSGSGSGSGTSGSGSGSSGSGGGGSDDGSSAAPE